MAIRKKILFYLIWVCVGLSCSKEDTTTEKIIPKPAGKYLSEIRSFEYPMRPINDTLKVVDIEYDEYRRLKKMNYYIFETQELRRTLEFSYNRNGQLDQMTIRDIGNPVSYEMNYIYNQKNLVAEDVYRIESGLKTLIQKYSFAKDAQNIVSVTKSNYSRYEGELVEVKENEKYYFNDDGNLYKAHFLIGTNTYLERIEEYEYDDKKNPFANFDIPYFDIEIRFISPCEYRSINNVVRQTTTHVALANEVSHDTITYQYEDDYPIEVNGRVFYKYIDLK